VLFPVFHTPFNEKNDLPEPQESCTPIIEPFRKELFGEPKLKRLRQTLTLIVCL